MQSHYPAEFDREYGCAESDWLRWLPGAARDQIVEQCGPGRACVIIGEGRLQLSWETLPARKIGLVHFPRQQVGFRFETVDEQERKAFMRYFDLYMQRGGG